MIRISVMTDKAANILDLLVQNPDSLAKEDLEKLCEAISKDALNTSESQQVDSQRCIPQIPHRQLPKNEMDAAVNSIIPKKMENQPFAALENLATATISCNKIAFQPVTVNTSCNQTAIPISNLGSGDGIQYFSNSNTGLPPLRVLNAKNQAKYTLANDACQTTSNAMRETASSRIFSYGKPKKIDHVTQPKLLGNEENIKMATVKSTSGLSQKKQPMRMMVGNQASIAFAYPCNTPWRYGDSLYRVQRPLKYTVPCSEQAIATTEWLLQNFEDNASSTVPRSVMYQEYVRHFQGGERVKYFNQAVFGKMVRACFPNLTTRRLGVRGHSRYHYAGLRVKPTSKYANCIFARGEPKAASAKTVHKKFSRGQIGVAANVTIDSSGKEESGGTQNGDSGNPDVPMNNINADDVLATYPGIEMLKDVPDLDRNCLRSFLAFYSGYNKQLLSYMKTLDHGMTKDHLQSFAILLPSDCLNILRFPFVRNVIQVCDGILYHQASEYLLPDCLATLSTEFKVAVRKYAKAFTDWVADVVTVYDVPGEVYDIRISGSMQWAEYVKRVTTLCHVSKEARKALKDQGIAKQLRLDLEGVEFDDISIMCYWCSSEEGEYGKDRDLATSRKYVIRFLSMLKERARLEDYISILDEIVEECIDSRDIARESTPELRTVETSSIEQQFLMKWTMYISKILTEITLKTSGSVGTFHLTSLLFGDYLNHVLCTKREKTAFMQVATGILRTDIQED